MTAQLQLNLLEWIDAGEAVLRNVGQFGPAYDRTKVERFQKATNVVAGIAANGPSSPPIPSVRVDGFWGAEVVSSLKVLLGLAPSNPFPHVFPNVYRYDQWNKPAIQTYIATGIATRRQQAQAAMAAQAAAPPAPNATAEAAQQAQAAVAAAHEPLTAPPAPEAPAAQPPPDVAPPGPQPPAPNGASTPVTIEEQRVFGRRQGTRGNDVPWFAIGLGVLAFTGVIGWAVYRKGKRSRS